MAKPPGRASTVRAAARAVAARAVIAGTAALAATSALAIAGCGGAAATGARPDAPAGATPAPWLWRVQAATGEGPVVWLYGTIHNGGRDDVPASAWDALDGAAVFVSELGELEPDPDALRAVMRLPRGKGLDQQLPADRWWDLRDALRGTIREDELKRVRPWYAMTLLTRVMSPSPDPAMDAALTRRAHDRGLPVEALETWEEQLARLGDSVGVDDLVEAIEARRSIRCDLSRNLAAYRHGDAPWMVRVFAAPLADSLVRPRNRRWLPAIEAHLGRRGAFVAVGIGHLVGADGLPAMLAAAGYRVEGPTAPGT